MAETPKPKQQPIQMAVELGVGSPQDQPVLANYATVSVAQGLAYLDFGFIEPAVLAMVAQAAQQGKPLPKTLKGARAVRVAVGLDVMQRLQQQLTQTLTQLRAKPQTKA
ncbi:MAG: hypothetical protein ACKOCD_06080 [Nitrospiraceae bacterium]